MADYEETQEYAAGYEEPAAEAGVGELRCCRKLCLHTTLARCSTHACMYAKPTTVQIYYIVTIGLSSPAHVR
jgi:hypothetical protein